MIYESRCNFFVCKKTRVLSSFYRERFELKSELFEKRWKLGGLIETLVCQLRTIDKRTSYFVETSAIAIGERFFGERRLHLQWCMSAIMQPCSLRNRIAVSFFRRCFLPGGLVEACLPILCLTRQSVLSVFCLTRKCV